MAGLQEYRRKRDFAKTAEPDGAGGGRPPAAAQGGLLCVQKHAARQTHWDLRLELDGVLKSWAVPKGPSYDPAVRRLAVQVEDHPLEYGDFEGTIPRGEYGGGTVMLWDTGTWEPVGEPREGLEKGELKIRLAGDKLRGGWVLVRTRGSDGDEGRAPQWLLIKERDEAARAGAPDPWGDTDRSVVSGRTMDEIAAGAEPGRGGDGVAAPSARTRTTAGSASLPDTVPLTAATLVHEPPDGDDWLHEVKYDGYRIAARVDGEDVRLLTRGGQDWTGRFALVARALAEMGVAGTWLDGEVVVFDRHGISDFQALQGSLTESSAVLSYIVFDLLFDEGEDLRRLPLRERKARLLALLARRGLATGVLRYGDHIEGGGGEVLAEACRRGLEGVVSKRAGDGYAGRRTTSWQKTKCGRRQEFVVGGYTEPAGSRTGLGALLLGVYDGNRLLYAGRVGSGIDDETLARLAARLASLERADPPFADPPRGASARGVHWVAPDLVAEVAFTGWTADHRLRQPVFKGLREDKTADAVVREKPAGRCGGPGGSRPGAGSRPRRSASAAAADGEAEVRGVRISHPDRPVFADAGLTKLDVVRYYDAVADLMVPYLARRPLTVIRCPHGVSADCFFQKHVTPSVPRSVSRTSVTGAHGGTTVYPVVDTPEMLLAMVQNGVVEFHVWGSQAVALERPDVLVFDLDPAPDVPWPQVREAARALRDELARRGLRSFLKTSGGKGLHVVVPVRPGPGWPRAAAWAREVVEALVERDPGRYTATMAKAERGGRVFIDHFRNGRGATAAAPYSLRARPGAPVAMPIGWDGLTRTGGGGDWTLERVLRRLRSADADPWQGFWEAGEGQEVPEKQ